MAIQQKNLVDIIVPVYGGYDHLERLIPALVDTLASFKDDVKVFFVDDCTPEELGRDAIEKLITSSILPHWKFIKAPANGGFSATNNLGASHGNGQYICMLNSDTVPHPLWLDHLVATLDKYPQAGGVGSKLLFPAWSKDPTRPAGKIQHAGVAFNAARMPYHLFLGWDADNPRVNRHLMMQAVTGACFLTRRRLWDQIGGLDIAYGIGNFEDIDLCLQIGERGYDIAYNPDSVLYHWGSGSNNTESSDRNAMIFLSRWADKVVSDDWKFW